MHSCKYRIRALSRTDSSAVICEQKLWFVYMTRFTNCLRTFPILRLLSAYSTWEDETRAKNVLIFVVLWSLFCSVLIMESFCFGKSKMHLQNFYKADCDLAQKWTICAELLTPFGRFSFPPLSFLSLFPPLQTMNRS